MVLIDIFLPRDTFFTLVPLVQWSPDKTLFVFKVFSIDQGDICDAKLMAFACTDFLLHETIPETAEASNNFFQGQID